MKAKLGLAIDSGSLSRYRVDAIVVVLLFGFTSVMTFLNEQRINLVLYQHFTEDVWFGSDIERVFSNMSLREAPNYRAKVHPLFTLLLFPIVKAVRTIGRVPPETAVKLVIAATTAIWVGLLFVVLRMIGCRRFDAALFCVLALSSAALMFWSTIPETYLFGSLSMLLALWFVTLSQMRSLPVWSYVLMSAATLSITTTNWMVGIAATAANHTWKRVVWISAIVLVVVAGLWVVQSRIFSATTFIADIGGEANYFLPKTSGGPIKVLLGFVLAPMVVPALQVIPSNRNQPEWPLLSVQHSLPGSGGAAGMIAVVLWVVLLGLGAWAGWTLKNNRKLRFVIAAGLVGQLALHLVYGEETFLYAIHLIPFLILPCAMATLTRWRSVALGLAMLLIVFAAFNNHEQFSQAVDFLNQRGPLRQQVPMVRSSLPTMLNAVLPIHNYDAE